MFGNTPEYVFPATNPVTVVPEYVNNAVVGDCVVVVVGATVVVVVGGLSIEIFVVHPRKWAVPTRVVVL